MMLDKWHLSTPIFPHRVQNTTDQNPSTWYACTVAIEHPIILVDCMKDNKEARSISADRRPIQVSIRDGDSPEVSNCNEYSPEISIRYRHNPDNKVIMNIAPVRILS
jgi:hypothetical protein